MLGDPGLAEEAVQECFVRLWRINVSTLRAGETLTVTAGGLPAIPHDALFILQGSSYRSQRLVRVIHGVAAGAATLPKSLRPGPALAAEDLSGVQASGERSHRHCRLDLIIFSISGQRA